MAIEKDEAVLYIRLARERLDEAKAEAERLGLSTSDFIRALLAQYFDGIVFQRKKS